MAVGNSYTDVQTALDRQQAQRQQAGQFIARYIADQMARRRDFNLRDRAQNELNEYRKADLQSRFQLPVYAHQRALERDEIARRAAIGEALKDRVFRAVEAGKNREAVESQFARTMSERKADRYVDAFDRAMGLKQQERMGAAGENAAMERLLMQLGAQERSAQRYQDFYDQQQQAAADQAYNQQLSNAQILNYIMGQRKKMSDLREQQIMEEAEKRAEPGIFGNAWIQARSGLKSFLPGGDPDYEPLNQDVIDQARDDVELLRAQQAAGDAEFIGETMGGGVTIDPTTGQFVPSMPRIRPGMPKTMSPEPVQEFDPAKRYFQNGVWYKWNGSQMVPADQKE